MEYDIDDDPPFVRAPRLDHDWWRWTAEYRTVFRLTFPTQIFWLIVYLLLFLVVAPKAFSHELVEGTGVVCDTQEQVERFAALGMSESAINQVNAGKNLCVMAMVRYISGYEVNQVRFDEHTLRVMTILVVQVYVPQGWLNVPPSIQFTLFIIPEEGA